MTEEKIKDIFKAYDPELSSSLAFVERLERNLNAVELIHQENAKMMKRNRMAVSLAACAGFITGVIFTLLFPYINALVENLTSSLITAFPLPDALYGLRLISWLLIGGISVLVALNTYTISFTLLSRNQ